MATTGKQGTGKHGHKDTQEPYPHTKDNKGGAAQSKSSPAQSKSSGHASGGKSAGSSAKSSSQDTSDLKAREYRDAQGNVHHHTRTAGKSK